MIFTLLALFSFLQGAGGTPPYLSLVPVTPSAGGDSLARSLGTDSVTRATAADTAITTATGRA